MSRAAPSPSARAWFPLGRQNGFMALSRALYALEFMAFSRVLYELEFMALSRVLYVNTRPPSSRTDRRRAHTATRDGARARVDDARRARRVRAGARADARGRRARRRRRRRRFERCNTHATTARDDDARDGDGGPATTATAMETALLTTLAREEDARAMREAFEAFAREGGRAREYCGDDADAYPCEESRRREAIFYENMRVVRALRDAEDDSAALGHRSKGRRSKRSAASDGGRRRRRRRTRERRSGRRCGAIGRERSLCRARDG